MTNILCFKVVILLCRHFILIVTFRFVVLVCFDVLNFLLTRIQMLYIISKANVSRFVSTDRINANLDDIKDRQIITLIWCGWARYRNFSSCYIWTNWAFFGYERWSCMLLRLPYSSRRVSITLAPIDVTRMCSCEEIFIKLNWNEQKTLLTHHMARIRSRDPSHRWKLFCPLSYVTNILNRVIWPNSLWFIL